MVEISLSRRILAANQHNSASAVERGRRWAAMVRRQSFVHCNRIAGPDETVWLIERNGAETSVSYVRGTDAATSLRARR